MSKQTLLPSRLMVATAAAILFAAAVATSPVSAQVSAWDGATQSGPNGSMRYQGPFVGFEFGGSLTPPWHYFRQSPADTTAAADAQARAAERYYADLDRMHRYQTREERYANDYRDRYSSGDPFYHSYRGMQPARPTDIYPPHVGMSPPGQSPLTMSGADSVPGVAFSRGPHGYGHQGRRSVHDAEFVPDMLRAACNRLISSLSRMRDGQYWLDRLQPHRIIASIDHMEFPGALVDLVEDFNAVANNPRMVLVARANGFADVHLLLAQYVRLEARFPESVSMDEGTVIEDRVLHEEILPSYPQPSYPLGESIVTPVPQSAAPSSNAPQMIPRPLPDDWKPVPRPETQSPRDGQPTPPAPANDAVDTDPSTAPTDDRGNDSVQLNRPVLAPPVLADSVPEIPALADSVLPRLPAAEPVSTVVPVPMPQPLMPEIDPTLQVSPNDLPPVQWLPTPRGQRE